MKRFLISILLLLQVAVLFGGTYQVNTDVLNVRSAPDKSASVLGVLRNGDIVEAEATSDPMWHEVEYGGRTAYVASAYLAPVASDDDEARFSWDSLTLTDIPDMDVLILFALTGVFLLVSCLIPARSWWLGLILLLAASAATVCMIYMNVAGDAELRFGGNLGIVIDFIVYGLLSFGYLYAVLKTFLNASDRNHVSVRWGWGWIPFLIASVPVVLDHYYQWNISLIVLMALAAHQAGFCIWTFVRFVRGGKVLAAIPVILVYLASSVAASAVISSFVTLFSYGIWI